MYQIWDCLLDQFSRCQGFLDVYIASKIINAMKVLHLQNWKWNVKVGPFPQINTKNNNEHQQETKHDKLEKHSHLTKWEQIKTYLCFFPFLSDLERPSRQVLTEYNKFHWISNLVTFYATTTRYIQKILKYFTKES